MIRPFSLIFVALSIAGVAVYAGLSAIGGQAGFPLDDAWIHQTYARSLAEAGVFAYVPGQPSAGSTSPLWTLLIAIGYKLNLDYRLWTYALGAASLALCGRLASQLSLHLWPDRPGLALTAGLVCIFEWHLAWAAASGMETVLFAALALALMGHTVRAGPGWRDGAVFGVLSGLLTLTRPEGLLLAALCGSAWIARPASLARARFVTVAVLGFGALAGPAVSLNLQASGTLFPNTFYAKQQEYAVYFSSWAAWLPRALDVIGAPFIGAQALLAPGFLLGSASLLRTVRDRSSWLRAVPVVWLLAHVGVYAARLPVTYQHGRYLIPIIPVVLLAGLHGSARLLERTRSRILRGVGVGSFFVTLAMFWLLGAGVYRADVQIIEHELVASARWIEANTPPDALIAAHDIGAIGYFARRPLLDLAGLISPEVIPIIRGEAALLELMRREDADYFAAPPDFYSRLLEAPELERVFAGNSPLTARHWLVFQLQWR